MAVDLDKLLSRVQKEKLIKERLQIEGVKGPFRLRYDSRYGWDFEVRKGNWPSVIFSLPISSPRFQSAVQECVRAIEDMRSLSTHATVLRGRTRP